MSYVPPHADMDLRRARREAFEEAAQVVERFRMPKDGDGPVILMEVLDAIARQLRGRR